MAVEPLKVRKAVYFLAVAVNLYLGKLHVVAVVVSSIDGTEFRDI